MIDYNKINKEYSAHRQKAHPEVLKSLSSTNCINRESKVLEVGCGTANYLVALEKATGCQSWGIDPSSQMLSAAMNRSSTIKFKMGRAEKLEFSSHFFDFIYSVDVIHHVKGHLEYFQEAYKVLKRGGYICTVTDSEWVLKNRQPLSTHFPDTIEVELNRYPRIAKLKDLMTRTGFIEIKDYVVAFSFKLTDIQAFRDKAYSSLHLISEDAFQKGISKLDQDLRKNGYILYISRYVLLWGQKP